MRLPSLIALAALAGCAAPRQSRDVPPPALPSAAEVSRYVASHWSDVGQTFARFANRSGEAAELLGVSEVSCRYTYGTPECSYEVTGRFGGAPAVRHRLFSQFERDATGGLVEVIVFWHERRR